jgi:hypothetical protein
MLFFFFYSHPNKPCTTTCSNSSFSSTSHFSACSSFSPMQPSGLPPCCQLAARLWQCSALSGGHLQCVSQQLDNCLGDSLTLFAGGLSGLGLSAVVDIFWHSPSSTPGASARSETPSPMILLLLQSQTKPNLLVSGSVGWVVEQGNGSTMGSRSCAYIFTSHLTMATGGANNATL